MPAGWDIAGGIGSALSDFSNANAYGQELQQQGQEHLEDRAFKKREQELSLQDYALRLRESREKLEANLAKNPEAVAARDTAERIRMHKVVAAAGLPPDQQKKFDLAIDVLPPDDLKQTVNGLLIPKPKANTTKLTPVQHPGVPLGFMKESTDPNTQETTTSWEPIKGAPTIPTTKVPGGEKTIGEKWSAKIAVENALRVKNGQPKLTPKEELDLWNRANAKKPISQFAVVDDEKVVRSIDQAKGIAEELSPIIDKVLEVSPDLTGGLFGSRASSIDRALESKWASVWYKHGITSDELSQLRDDYFRLIGMFKMVASQPYMKGRPSKFYLDQISQHLPIPEGDPLAAKKRLEGTIGSLTKYRNEVLRHNKIDPSKWDAEGSGSGSDSGEGAGEFSVEELNK